MNIPYKEYQSITPQKDLIKFYNEQMFIESCCNAPLNTIQKIYQLSIELNNTFDINATNDKGISAFIQCCIFGRFRVAKWLYSLSLNLDNPIKDLIIENYSNPFYVCCASEYGNLQMAKWLYDICIDSGAPISIHGPYDNDGLFIITKNPGISEWLCDMGIEFDSVINIHANNDLAFKLRCSEDLESAQWLYYYSLEINSPIDINGTNENLGVKYNAFISAIEAKQLNIAKWLYQIGLDNDIPIDIRVNDDYAFKISCQQASIYENNYIEIVLWLCTLYDKYSTTINNNGTVNYEITE